MRLLAPVRRGTFLVLLGATLGSVALTVGVVLKGPTPVAASAPEPVQAANASAGSPPTVTTTTEGNRPVVRFKGVAGPACPLDASRNVRMSAGWQVVPGDSWTGDGCGDRFFYSAPDDPNFVQWRFMLDGTAKRVCRVAVFVPDSALASDRVWYGIADRFESPDYRVGGFTVDQKANRGKWVNGMTVHIHTAAFMVNVDGVQNRTGVTASAVRLSCGK